jgi:hypothetical protein
LDILFVVVHLPLKAEDYSLVRVWVTPYGLILKLSWDSNRLISSDFTLRKRKKSAVVRFDK